MIGSQIIHKDFCENSIKWCKENFDSLKDGTVLIADKYGYAIGRQGRTWQVSEGQLLITFVLKKINIPKEKHESPSNCKYSSDKHLNHLNMSMSLGIIDSLKKHGCRLKWPNDFVINNKKVGGMIVHTIWESNSTKGVIVGVGININNIFVEENNLYSIATSIRQETKTKLDIQKLRDDILLKLNSRYNQYRQKEYITIFQEWKNSQSYLGKKILAHKINGELISGTMKDVDSDGNLFLVDKFEKNHTLSFQSVDNISV